MRDAYQNLIFPDVMQMIQEDDVEGLAAFCGVVHPASVAEILEELEDQQVWRILDQAGDQLRVEIFEFLSLKRQTELAESLDGERLSHLLEWMSADDRVDLLSRIPRWQDRVLTSRDCRMSIERACQRLGLPHFGHHSFRHFFATDAIESGVNVRTLAQWLGHLDGGVLLLKTYSHVWPSQERESANRMQFSANAIGSSHGQRDSERKDGIHIVQSSQ